MAMETETKNHAMETETKNQELKHLGFVRIAAIRALVCVSNLYNYGKNNSGPLKSTVSTVEGTVTAVVNPVYEKFRTLPDHLLAFLDHKVDEAAHKFDKHAPPVAKHVVSHAQNLIQKTTQKAQELVNQAKASGPRAAVHYAATEYKHFVLDQSVKVWSKLDKYSTVHSVTEVAVPAAANLSDKYNHFVTDMTQKGYTLFTYAPLVPIDEIAKAFKQGESKKKEDVTVANAGSDSSDSD